MKDYIHRIMRYKTITRISKEWYNMRLISKSEYRKVCRIIAKDFLIDVCSIFQTLLCKI